MQQITNYIFDASGRHLRTSTAPADTPQHSGDEIAVEKTEEHSGQIYYDIALQKVMPCGECPDVFNFVFDLETKQWKDRRSIEQHRAEKWAKVKAAREAAIHAPLQTPYGVFDADEKSQKSITDAVLMLQTMAGMGLPATIVFTLADNTPVTITLAQMVTVGLLLGQRVQTAHATARALRDAIDAAQTVEELEALAPFGVATGVQT